MGKLEEVQARITELLDRVEELPQEAEDFAHSVQVKLESMRDWIDENQRVTSKQLDAIEKDGAA